MRVARRGGGVYWLREARGEHMTDSGTEHLDDQLRIAAEWARDAADAISAWQAAEPDFTGDDEAWSEYEEALTALSAAYYQTTHSGLGLVSGELLAAALPSLAMRQWDAAAELARTGAAYAEIEARHIEQGGERYGYASSQLSLGAVDTTIRYVPDIAAEPLVNLVAHARAVSEVAFEHWQATVDAPVEEWPEEPDRTSILEQLSEDFFALDVAGDFASSSRPPLEVLVDATVASLMRGSWATVYPFATATAVLAEYQSHLLEGTAVATTPYFEYDVRRRRPYLDLDMCRSVIASPLRTERQATGRISHWGWITLAGEAEPRILRVVTLEDGKTIHNAFIDSNFLRKWRRSR